MKLLLSNKLNTILIICMFTFVLLVFNLFKNLPCNQIKKISGNKEFTNKIVEWFHSNKIQEILEKNDVYSLDAYNYPHKLYLDWAKKDIDINSFMLIINREPGRYSKDKVRSIGFGYGYNATVFIKLNNSSNGYHLIDKTAEKELIHVSDSVSYICSSK